MSEKKPVEFNVFGKSQVLPIRPESSKTKDVIMLESTILFAKRGYEAVSIRDIAAAIKMKPSSLYNHFSGKEALFEAVLNHAEDLYLLYFKYLEEMLSRAQTLSEVLDILNREPAKMSNDFTCYAFSLILTEQFRDRHCAKILNETFLDYSTSFMKQVLDRCIEKGLAFPFDTHTVASLLMHSTLICINLRVHEYLDHRPPIDFEAHFRGIKHMIMSLAGLEGPGLQQQPPPPAPGEPAPEGDDRSRPRRKPRDQEP
ncbi:MAG: TetR/AcrR family transcriptional regulator [Deltaproteobacteria bacterium]|jgi:AcrR family transcriptional regulator|nr:TetR/AcrR family transcriptional regulator [Deltaproteobacteria bacterium]